MASSEHYDAVILGGGLAGLSLAIQLKTAEPGLSVLVAEKHPYPLPEAAHKVGESSVEGGARYLGQVIGMEEHIKTQQLPKLGLRFFWPADGNHDIARRVELGVTQHSKVPSYQLDRGRFENALAERARSLGVRFLDGCKVEQVTLGAETHNVTLVREGASTDVSAGWVVDATGRSSLLKRQLGLAQKNDHAANAAWFRVADRIAVDDWSDDPEWRNYVPSGQRWLSTTHLMGRGYWVWLIPLASGSTSIGIVADPAYHPFDEMNTFERAMKWLTEHEPQCAAAVEARRDRLQDFRVLKHYSHGCGTVFSDERWALTGEAGLFLDPLYSLGSDLIGVSNSYITDLILRTNRGESIEDIAPFYSEIYHYFYETSLTIYQDQYYVFGNAQVMVAKYLWDFTSYSLTLCLMEFHDKFADPEFMLSVLELFQRTGEIFKQSQIFFREWDALERADWTSRDSGHMINPFSFEPCHRAHVELTDPLTDDELRERLAQNLALEEVIMAEMFRHAATLVGSVPDDQPINPYAISLQPERWKDDGLFDGDITVPKNEEMAAQLEPFWFARRAHR
jgi:flavin-dependent dehydrogenase